MKVLHIIQTVCAVIILAFLTVAVIYAKRVKSVAQAQGSESVEEFYKKVGDTTTRENFLAAQAMAQAKEFIKAGDYSKANVKLRFLINFYSTAQHAEEARMVLGAINMDQILSPANPIYKVNYTIKSGDSLSRIASKHDTTVENIMELNGLMFNNRIHPGQKLVLMSLNFKTIIDLSEQTLSLYENDTFIKHYKIRDIAFQTKEKVIRTQIGDTMGLDGDSLVSRVSSRYSRSRKVNTLALNSLQIRPVKHPDEPDPGAGFFLSNDDMEEYNLFVRKGSLVEIHK